MLTHLTDTERIWLGWYRRLRVAGYVGTVDSMHRHMTGRPHPRARRRKLSEAELEALRRQAIEVMRTDGLEVAIRWYNAEKRRLERLPLREVSL